MSQCYNFESDEHPDFAKQSFNTQVWGIYCGQMKPTKCEISLINLIVDFNGYDWMKLRKQHDWFMVKKKKIPSGGAVGLCSTSAIVKSLRMKTAQLWADVGTSCLQNHQISSASLQETLI